ncbi:hypothetical protein QTL86_13630 [Cellulosilyticum sp. ST5]|uniref:hypothetical protein n=1 Tax=Cellulosilyticum sp. ST5 TaxID=3055805 RepID=UPI0039779BA2
MIEINSVVYKNGNTKEAVVFFDGSCWVSEGDVKIARRSRIDLIARLKALGYKKTK